MPEPPAPATGPARTAPDVFISYAREDRAFVERLRQALVERGRTVWVDLDEILPTEEWWAKIRAGIESSDHFVYILSPDSIGSEVCRRELAHAVENHKRLVPVLHRDVETPRVPAELGARQWLPFRAGDAFDAALDLLTRTFDLDPAWVNGHTRWQVRAIDWQRAGQDRSRLLRGRELRDAEQWLMRAGPALEPSPTDLQTQFIVASRRTAAARQRLALAVVSAGLVVAIGLAVFAWLQRNEAVRQARIALGRQLAAQAALMTRPSDLERRVVLAIESMKREPTPDAHRILRDAVATLPQRVAVMTQTGPVVAVAFAPGATALATAGHDGAVHIWDLAGRELARMAHAGPVNAVAFSPDGRVIGSASQDRTARLWDVASGRELVKVAHDSEVLTIAFAPDGGLFATGGLDYTARIWETATGRSMARLDHGDVVNKVVFSPDGRWLATASGFPTRHMLRAAGRKDLAPDDSARVWDVKTGRERLRLAHAHNVRDIAFSPDGRVLASASLDGTARLWRLPGGGLLHRFELEAGVTSIGFSADGRYVAAGAGAFFFSGTARAARVWDVASGRELARLAHADDVQAVAFTPDGAHLATASQDGVARLWTIATGEEVLRMSPGGESSAEAVAIAPDGRTFATAHTSGMAAIWRAPARPWRLRVDHAALVRQAAFDQEGRTLLSLSDDSVVQVTDLAAGESRRFESGARAPVLTAATGGAVAAVTGTSVRVLAADGRELMAAPQQAPVQRVALSPGGSLLAAGFEDRSVAVWRVSDGTMASRLRLEQSPANLWFDDAARRLAVSAEKGLLSVWDPERGTEISRLSHGAEPQDVQFSGDGRRLVSRAEDRIVRVWEVDSGRELARRTHPTAVRAVAISRDGARVVSGSGEGVVVWDVATGRDVTRFTHPGGTAVLAFSHDGCCVASGGFNDRTARVWDVAAGRELLDVAFPVAVERVLFSPDDRLLAVVTGTALSRADHAVHVWRWRGADLMAEACARLTRNLRLDDWEQRLDGPYEATCPGAPEHPVEMLRQGSAFAAAGDVRRAGLAFGEAVRAAVIRTDAATSNAICWSGSLDGFARLVLPACDHAVRRASADDRGAYIDSRGIARAMSGDRRGAIEDLTAGLVWLRANGASKPVVARRESWLAALRGGRDPFDAAAIDALKKEP